MNKGKYVKFVMIEFLHSHIYLCRHILQFTENGNYDEQALDMYLISSHYIKRGIVWINLSNLVTFSTYHQFLYVISLVCNIVTLK